MGDLTTISDDRKRFGEMTGHNDNTGTSDCTNQNGSIWGTPPRYSHIQIIPGYNQAAVVEMHTMPAPARILVRIVDSMAHRYEAPQEHAASPSVTRCGAVGLGMACQNAKDFPAIREWSLKPGIFIGEWWTLIICHCWSVRKTKAWRQSAATSSCMGTIQQVLKYLTNNSDIFGAVSAAPRKKKTTSLSLKNISCRCWSCLSLPEDTGRTSIGTPVAMYPFDVGMSNFWFRNSSSF